MDSVTFRAIRETLGLSVRECAAMLGVSERTINRWELKGDQYPIPSAIGDRMNGEMDTMLSKVEFIVSTAKGMPKDARIHLPYYRNQAHYDEMGRDNGPVGMVNGLTRAAYIALSTRGYKVDFTNGPTDWMLITRDPNVPKN